MVSSVSAPAVSQPTARSLPATVAAAKAAPSHLPYTRNGPPVPGLEIYYKDARGAWVQLTPGTKLKVGTNYEFFAVYNKSRPPGRPRKDSPDNLGRWTMTWGAKPRIVGFFEYRWPQLFRIAFGKPAKPGASAFASSVRVDGIKPPADRVFTTWGRVLDSAKMDRTKTWQFEFYQNHGRPLEPTNKVTVTPQHLNAPTFLEIGDFRLTARAQTGWNGRERVFQHFKTMKLQGDRLSQADDGAP